MNFFCVLKKATVNKLQVTIFSVHQFINYIYFNFSINIKYTCYAQFWFLCLLRKELNFYCLNLD